MKKSDLIFNIISSLLIIFIMGVCIYISVTVTKDNNKVYVQKWINEETGVCYLITNTAIIEMRNPDGTLHTETH